MTTAPPRPDRRPYEDTILSVWKQLLDRSDIDVTDDVFALGGPALAPAVAAQIRKRIGVDVPVMEVFESRTVSALAAAVAARRATARGTVVPPRPPDSEPVLSFDQQRIWLETQLLPDGVYNNHARRKLVGPLDVAVIEQSIGSIIRRHESLRTRFVTIGDKPIVVVEPPDDTWRIGYHDVSDIADADVRTATALRWLEEDASTQFDLSAGPMFRCMLVKLGDKEHLLGITMHQIISDSHSIYAFERELGLLYAVGGDAERAGLPPLPVQYRDYAVWQRGRMVGPELDRQVGYWRRHLEGAPPILALPTCRRRTAEQTAASGRVECDLTVEDTAAVRRLCRTHDVTPFMVLLAGLSVVFGRWSGQSEVVIGVAYEGRADSDVDKLLGIFFNALPMRSDLSGNPTFTELLARTRKVALDGFEHAEAPIDVVLSELQVPRDPRRTPVFEVVLNVTAPPEIAPVGDLNVEFFGTSIPRTRYDLFINAQEYAGRLRLTLDYGSDRFDEATMRLLAEHLEALICAATADPDRGVFEYPLDRAGVEGSDAFDPIEWSPAHSGVTGADTVAVLPDAAGLRQAADAAAAAGGAAVVEGTGSAAWLDANGVTVLYANAPTVRALAAAESGPAALDSVRMVVVENRGDLLPHDIQALRAIAPRARVVAVYGVDVEGVPIAVHEITGEWDPRSAPLRVPLGREVTGRHVELRTPSGRPAETGEIGEICMGELRTGDVGRRHPNGVLDFVRRLGDDPIVDPAETLAALRDVPGVVDAVVVQHDGALSAAIAGRDLDAVKSRNLLRARLPSYLVPEQIAALGAIPRTADGEYDMAAVTGAGPDDRATLGYVAPRTPIEHELAAVLRDLLDIERVGVHDSFFELGGFSMLATKLTARIQSIYGVELALRDVFDSPSIDELAQLVVRAQSALSDADELEAMLDEIQSGEPDPLPAPEDGGSRPARLDSAVAHLMASVVFAPDKPDETPESTARALWLAASGSLCSAQAAAARPIPSLSPAQERAFDQLVERRVMGEPLAYLTGRTSFLGHEFLAAPGALIPRRETELLGDSARQLVRSVADGAASEIRVLDLGTGAGNIAVAIAISEPTARVWASDLEPDAAIVAERNANFHGVDHRMTFGVGDLFAALAQLPNAPDRFDVVVCNPPYMPSDKARQLPVEVGGYEPTAAFDGGEVGLSVVNRLIAEAPSHIVPGGWLAFEIGAGMGRVAARRLEADGGYDEIRTVKDSQGIVRVLLARTRKG